MNNMYTIDKNEKTDKWEFTITTGEEVKIAEFPTMNMALENVTLIYVHNLVLGMLENKIPMAKMLDSMSKYFVTVTEAAVKQAKKTMLNASAEEKGKDEAK
jgi:hypothetical protein